MSAAGYSNGSSLSQFREQIPVQSNGQKQDLNIQPYPQPDKPFILQEVPIDPEFVARHLQQQEIIKALNRQQNPQIPNLYLYPNQPQFQQIPIINDIQPIPIAISLPNGRGSGRIYEPSGLSSKLENTKVKQQMQMRLKTQLNILIELFLFVLDAKKNVDQSHEQHKRQLLIQEILYAFEAYKIKKVWLKKRENLEKINKIEKELFSFWNEQNEQTYFKNIIYSLQGQYYDQEPDENQEFETNFGNKILNWQLSDKDVNLWPCLIKMIENLKADDIEYIKINLTITPGLNFQKVVKEIIDLRKITLLQLFCIVYLLSQQSQGYQDLWNEILKMMDPDSIFQNKE